MFFACYSNLFNFSSVFFISFGATLVYLYNYKIYIITLRVFQNPLFKSTFFFLSGIFPVCFERGRTIKSLHFALDCEPVILLKDGFIVFISRSKGTSHKTDFCREMCRTSKLRSINLSQTLDCSFVVVLVLLVFGPRLSSSDSVSQSQEM